MYTIAHYTLHISHYIHAITSILRAATYRLYTLHITHYIHTITSILRAATYTPPPPPLWFPVANEGCHQWKHGTYHLRSTHRRFTSIAEHHFSPCTGISSFLMDAGTTGARRIHLWPGWKSLVLITFKAISLGHFQNCVLFWFWFNVIYIVVKGEGNLE